MSKSKSISRELNHAVDEQATSKNILANLSEEDQNRVQLSKIKRWTVEPGVMKLPVSVVTKAKNSEKWAIEVEHPLEGTLRFYRDAPLHGWTKTEGGIVEMMEWYDIRTEDPYQLQLMKIYMEKTGDSAEQAHGWEPVAPPDYSEPLTERVKETYRNISVPITRPNRSLLGMWVMLCVGAIIASVVSATIAPMSIVAIILTPLVFVATTVVGLIVMEPPEEKL